MSPQELDAYIQAGYILIEVGKATVAEVKAMFGAHPKMTDDDLNAILDGTAAEAARRGALAAADAGEVPGGTGTTS